MSVDEWVRFTNRLSILKAHNPFARRKKYKCSRRLVVNVYKGCLWSETSPIEGRCLYCYAVTITRREDLNKPKPKVKFTERLEKDIYRLPLEKARNT